MRQQKDGPVSALFTALSLRGNVSWPNLPAAGVSEQMAAAAPHAPTGSCVGWGIPFKVGRPVVIRDGAVAAKLDRVRAPWLVFVHTSDVRPQEPNEHGFVSPTRGRGQLGEHAADYVIVYADGTEVRAPVRRRHELGAFTRGWGENCFEAVPHRKPQPSQSEPGQLNPNSAWGRLQYRVAWDNFGPWINWLWAWENPHPRKAIVGIRFEPTCGTVVISAVSAGKASSQPLRWRMRRKAVLRLPQLGP